jgi:hypothetical protein
MVELLNSPRSLPEMTYDTLPTLGLDNTSPLIEYVACIEKMLKPVETQQSPFSLPDRTFSELPRSTCPPPGLIDTLLPSFLSWTAPITDNPEFGMAPNTQHELLKTDGPVASGGLMRSNCPILWSRLGFLDRNRQIRMLNLFSTLRCSSRWTSYKQRVCSSPNIYTVTSWPAA